MSILNWKSLVMMAMAIRNLPFFLHYISVNLFSACLSFFFFCCCLLLFKVSIWAIRMMKQLKVKCDYELNRPFPPKQKKKVYGDNYTNMLTCTLNKCSVQTFHWNGSEWCANSQAKELNCKKFKLKLIECESS